MKGKSGKHFKNSIHTFNSGKFNKGRARENLTCPIMNATFMLYLYLWVYTYAYIQLGYVCYPLWEIYKVILITCNLSYDHSVVLANVKTR